MVKIRLARFGAKKAPYYRIVVIDEQKKVRGISREIVGWWNPKKQTKEIDKAKIEEWVKKGAIVSPAVKKLMS